MNLGRASQSAFKHSSSEETSSPLIRTASDVFGPKGDKKSGCQEEWLAHCDSCQVGSQFTSDRNNCFDNLFENPQAIFCTGMDLFISFKIVSHTRTLSCRALVSISKTVDFNLSSQASLYLQSI